MNFQLMVKKFLLIGKKYLTNNKKYVIINIENEREVTKDEF